MRVKIAYTVELEEVEREVSEIMCRAAADLDFAYQEVTRIQVDLDTKTGNLNSKIQQLDTIRRKMAKADQILSDCQSILQGLEQTKKQIEEQENEIQDG
jgi:chromosome segregation ATPase